VHYITHQSVLSALYNTPISIEYTKLQTKWLCVH